MPAVAGVPEAARQAAASIDPEKIRAHVRFLADDLLEGRGPGTRGGDIAAQYIGTQFALYGLQPAGDNGTYFQKVPLYAVHTIEDQTKFSFVPQDGAPIALTYGSDYVTKDQTGAASADIDAPIVFVGYGIDAPEYHWNDYAGVDVKGKVLLVIVNQPPSDDPAFFKGKTMTYYGRWTYKYEEAARRGAVGVLIIHRTDLASYPWDVVRNSQSVEKSYLKGDPDATLKAASWIQLDVAKKLFAAAGKNADDMIVAAGKPGFHSFELPVRLKAHVASRVRPYESDNVIAKLPGADTDRPRPGRFLHGALRSPGDRSRSEGRQHLQRRGRQRHGLRDSAGTGAGVCGVSDEAAAQYLLRSRYGGGAGAAGIAVSGHASSDSGVSNCFGPELRHADADWGCRCRRR